MKKIALKLGLSRETLRHLDDVRLAEAAAAETGTATFTCENHTCDSCATCFITCDVTCKCP
ncbi:MAG TPA: hypothetical protein VMW75_03310 [Thermoanaerobaculia bacterium]|nr:hypothetical protein [Thermoanaerobaculia bacterium]